jgi:hypothetical protein
MSMFGVFPRNILRMVASKSGIKDCISFTTPSTDTTKNLPRNLVENPHLLPPLQTLCPWTIFRSWESIFLYRNTKFGCRIGHNVPP